MQIKGIIFVASSISLLILSGCGNMLKTMVAHYNLSTQDTLKIARWNAMTNVCLSEKAVSPVRAYEFSMLAAEVMEVTVSDTKFYNSSYNNAFSQIQSGISDPQFKSFCAKLDNELPRFTAQMRESFESISRELNIARSQENQRIAQQLRDFGSQRGSYPVVIQSFPKIVFSSEQPQTQNYLVKTDGGIRQCRVTNSGYVFCL